MRTSHAITRRPQPRLEAIFGVDVRSLAAFRIGLGTLLLVNLGLRARWLTAHYSDAGVLPRSALWASDGIVVSLHGLSGDVWFQGFLFVVAAVAASLLLVGYRTRMVTALSWILLISMHARNPYVINSGDAILGLLLFWGIFLPLGARWSIDALKAREATPVTSVLSVATVGALLQVGMIYVFSVFLKTDPVWTSEHTAIYYALNLGAFTTGIGQMVASMPTELLALMTRGTLALELWGPILAFVPVLTAPIRTLVVFAFASFHLGLAVTMTLGLFPFSCIVGWLLFLPSSFWNRVRLQLPSLSMWANRMAASFRSQSTARGSGRNGQLGPLSTICLVFVLFYSVQANVYSVTHTMLGGRAGEVWSGTQRVADAVGFKQHWRMFAPRPTTSDGWYVMEGVLENGASVNLFDHAAPLPWEEPRLISKSYQNARWRKYLHSHYQRPQFEPNRMHLRNYLQDRWERAHPDQPLVRIEITMMRKTTQPPGEVAGVSPELLHAGSRDVPEMAENR